MALNSLHIRVLELYHVSFSLHFHSGGITIYIVQLYKLNHCELTSSYGNVQTHSYARKHFSHNVVYAIIQFVHTYKHFREPNDPTRSQGGGGNEMRRRKKRKKEERERERETQGRRLKTTKSFKRAIP